ncbi:uncharacterized protein LOC141632926 [Silene latifolia]|uniref:uncharacterized protein LOC141632926 n=1 Tax=Silene latifolia TaxID=37657 RepID=UPI003D78609F
MAPIAFRDLDSAKRSFLSQKAKAQWMSDGDENSSYFYIVMKARRIQNRILCIQDRHGVTHTTVNNIEEAFEDYYKQLLGTRKIVGDVHFPSVRQGKVVSEDQESAMTRAVTDEEIRDALFSIPANKAPGPDGYSSQFFKDAYSVVGKDILKAVKEFFDSGKLLKQVNSTTLTLIPKKDRPISAADFTPIVCYDLLMFCRGDRGSIKIILKAFATFSNASGLEMNCDKSNIYFNGIGQNEVELIEKVVARLRGWSAMKLSYTGRLVMVQVVLSQLYVYWSRIFVIHVTVINRISTICRNYLWSASEQYGRAPTKISWESVCTLKKIWGLGLVNSRQWNLAMIGKFTWWLASKSDHLWIQWVDHMYMKGTDWHDYEPTQYQIGLGE